MAHYLILDDQDPPLGFVVEAKNIARAIEAHDAEDGERLVVYRIADGPRKVNVSTEMIRRIEIE